MPDTSIVIQAQDTAFQRQGRTVHTKGFYFPVLDAAIVNNAYKNSALVNALAAAEQELLAALLPPGFDPTVLPGGITLKNVQSLFPSAFNGAPDLQAIYQKDPFSSQYEDETRALYERQYLKARAAAQSGPANVRGATARQAFELVALDVEMANNRFREIWQAQMALAALVTAAVQAAAQAENEKWRLQLQAQQQQAVTEQGRMQQSLSASDQIAKIRDAHARFLGLAAELLGIPKMTIDEVLEGFGSQGSATTTFGMSYWR